MEIKDKNNGNSLSVRQILDDVIGYLEATRMFDGRMVEKYSDIYHNPWNIHQRLKDAGFEAKLLGAYHCYWVDREGLRAVEYAEGDVYVETFKDEESLDKEIEKAILIG